MGELSSVVHLGEGEVVYRPSESGDALYIINRGVVELVPRPIRCDGHRARIFLAAIFSEIARHSSDLPRSHLMRTREKVRLQRIQSKDFAELTKRVPCFLSLPFRTTGQPPFAETTKSSLSKVIASN